MKHQGGEMVAHAILFIVLPLAVAWFAGVTAYLPPYSLPAPKTEPVEPEFEAEVRAFLVQQSEPDAAPGRRGVPGVRGNALMDGAASAAPLGANDRPSGAQSRADQGHLAA